MYKQLTDIKNNLIALGSRQDSAQTNVVGNVASELHQVILPTRIPGKGVEETVGSVLKEWPTWAGVGQDSVKCRILIGSVISLSLQKVDDGVRSAGISAAGELDGGSFTNKSAWNWQAELLGRGCNNKDMSYLNNTKDIVIYVFNDSVLGNPYVIVFCGFINSWTSTFMDLMKITVQDTLRELDGYDYSKNVLISSKEEVQLKS